MIETGATWPLIERSSNESGIAIKLPEVEDIKWETPPNGKNWNGRYYDLIKVNSFEVLCIGYQGILVSIDAEWHGYNGSGYQKAPLAWVNIPDVKFGESKQYSVPTNNGGTSQWIGLGHNEFDEYKDQYNAMVYVYTNGTKMQYQKETPQAEIFCPFVD